MAKTLISLAPASLRLGIVEIGQLPIDNQDRDEGTPPIEWTTFRGRMQGFEAILFVTAEYNRSVPAVLNMPTMQPPEAYVGGPANLFDAAGNLAPEAPRAFVAAVLAAFPGLLATPAPG